MTASSYRYRLFGLRIASEWEIASLHPVAETFSSPPDVEIEQGEVRLPKDLDLIDGIEVGVLGASCFLSIAECGAFEVRSGSKVIIDPDPGVTADQISLYLLGSVFGLLLHQRGLLPFHCNAVELDGAAYLFCGESGAGKSTLAAHFVERGFNLLSDDVCALHFEADGQLMASAGVPRLKLWRDTLGLFDRRADGLRLVPWYDDKFEVPLQDSSAAEPAPVVGIYHLRVAGDGREPGIYPLRGLGAANAVTANIYRRRLGDLVGATRAYLATAARIVREVPVFSMNRVWDLARFKADAATVELHMRQLSGGGGMGEWIPDGPRGWRDPAKA